ncbi:MAG TPA: C25 family cysteine peptidase [Ferruginibacter sp.]|nr:C25 family cysteine peptidase [Ferruginibacter sp.]HMP20115.1 C25 family cysteine peptidase [Ferruginibacter sp.]
MRKLLMPLLLLLTITAGAQLNNSWIDYSKTYYKFNVWRNGVCRINQPVLNAAGLGNIPAEQFQLWRNGEQVRLYTSVSTGLLGASDYIEFLGKANDGLPDKGLYRDPSHQLCDSFSLFSDTAVYFLTVNNGPGNLRYSNRPNNVAGNTLAPEPYFMRRVTNPYKTQYNRGYAIVVGEYVYSSSYDMGEGWTSSDAGPCCDLFREFTGLNVYTAGPANSVSMRIAAFGNALNLRNFRVRFFNNQVLNTPMNFFDKLVTEVNNIPLSYLQNPNTLQVGMNGTSSNPNDRVVVADVSITYPATFNFNGTSNFYFELQPSANGNFLVIDNFNIGAGVQPVLYGLNDGSRYVGDISEAGKVKFVLPPSLDPVRRFNLVSQDASNINSIAALSSKTFTNYALSAMQGDYIIISNPVLYNDGKGVNYVEQYSQYRASGPGGSYKPIIVPIDELTDQFAFGIRRHPAAIRDFLRFATSMFAVTPKYVFIIGRGMTALDFRQNQANPVASQIDLVPTFGWPASDILLACEPGKFVPMLPIGRIGAVNGTEVKQYLDKVKVYEQRQQSQVQVVADKSWMKNIVHVVAGADSIETSQFRLYMDNYKKIIEDPVNYGGYVETFEKSSTSSVEQANGERIERLIHAGLGLISYFGHSSANTLAFNLTSPEMFNNEGRYTFFNVSGCSAGNFFAFEPQRLQGNQSISEKYVLADRKGSIGFLASTHLGIPPFLNTYNIFLYNNISRNMYGNTIGNQMRSTINSIAGNSSSLDFYNRIHIEELNLHGDPAIRINSFDKPDYAIEDQMVRISPAVLTVAETHFTLQYKIQNLGKAVKDSFRVQVKRTLPDQSIQTIFDELVPATAYADSNTLVIPINPVTDKGLNKITVSVDTDNHIDELSETNNSITKEFYIFDEDIKPIYPYNYSIVNQQNITFSASTANPLGEQRQYLMELDTTELFNSPFKKQYNLTGTGGIVQFNPGGLTFTDSTVYYWRTAMTQQNNQPLVWNNASFIYLAGSSTGFNQSHYYQHKHSSYSNTIKLDDDRSFRYNEINRSLQVRTGLWPYANFDRINVTLDFDQIEQYGCVYNVLQFLVYDSATLKPWENYSTGPGVGRFGSAYVCPEPTRKFFEFSFQDSASRRKAMDFLDNIPAGMFVSITNLGTNNQFNNVFISDWMKDTLTLGPGKSLYHKLKSMGFGTIDSFTRNLPFVYFFRKGRSDYPLQQVMGENMSDLLTPSFTVPVRYQSGTIESPLFGPAKAWTALHWRGKSYDTTPTDETYIEVYGVKADGSKTLVTTVSPAIDTTLAFINAQTYPYVQLKMYNSDEVHATPHQLQYWRINADYLPEGAVAPNVLFTIKDSVEQGQPISVALAFKNISTIGFDSIKAKYIITNSGNVSQTFELPRLKPLQPNDTATVRFNIDTKDYAGVNTLNIVVNPDNDQPELYLGNNFLVKEFYVNYDNVNPLLDVTFDGVHILNRDIVSSRPHILIKLTDENRFAALTDTALLKVMVQFPDGRMHNYFFGENMIFNAANLSSGENAATIDFRPNFEEDGEYVLIVTGRDALGNKAGNLAYRVHFTVINKAMISNLLNYPNPFTTSTAFVFTVTGSQVPQNLRIQILTITGKVVKEITKAELGDIHIGRNITEYKWDGTDMYGQKLANGVYLYRVLTNLNGKSLEKYKADGDNTDKYFKAGYGKMYLMR